MTTSIQNNTQVVNLPPLVKGSNTYKLVVPKKVEEKIRYLCRKFPNLEWSGVLFTSHKGSFEDGSLVITCQDIYPMDLGSSTFTDFKMDESVAGYIAENFELFGCDMSLIHSHNNFSCFFSGTDQSTLRSEGNDQNCFVSLIVNNEGTYCAAITRKIKEKKEVTTYYHGKSYEFFGDGEIKIEPPYQAPDVGQKYLDVEAIEYFMLDVEVEKVDNPLSYLDKRFDEISEKKKAQLPKNIAVSTQTANLQPRYAKTTEYTDYSFSEWKKLNSQEPTLFDDEVMEDMIDWEPDSNIIHSYVSKMLALSLNIRTDNFDIDTWINKHLNTRYNEIFGEGGSNSEQFDTWAEFVIEFMIDQYRFDIEFMGISSYDIDYFTYQSKIANAMFEILLPYEENPYIGHYCDILMRYINE